MYIVMIYLYEIFCHIHIHNSRNPICNYNCTFHNFLGIIGTFRMNHEFLFEFIRNIKREQKNTNSWGPRKKNVPTSVV